MESQLSSDSIRRYLDICSESGYFAALQAINSDTQTIFPFETSGTSENIFNAPNTAKAFLENLLKEDSLEGIEKTIHKKIALAALDKKYNGPIDSEDSFERIMRKVPFPLSKRSEIAKAILEVKNFSPISDCVIEDNTRKDLTEEDKVKKLNLEVEERNLQQKLRSLETREDKLLSIFESWEEGHYWLLRLDLLEIYHSKKEVESELFSKMLERYQLTHY